MGLLDNFLRLPLTDTEQECLVRILQSRYSVQNHEILLTHHLQHANYIPALNLSQTLQMNHMNNHDSLLQERYSARNSTLAQCGKGVPRVEQKLTIERAKPSNLLTSFLPEFLIPKQLPSLQTPTLKRNKLPRSFLPENEESDTPST